MLAYLNGEFVPKQKALISPDDRGFLFADGVYEVIHSYDGMLFKFDEHLARLERSIREIRLDFAETRSLRSIAEKLIGENSLFSGEALVYIQITRGAAPRNHGFPPQGVRPTVYITTMNWASHGEEREKGISVILMPDIRWLRCDIKSVALLPNIMAHQRALDRGADEAIFVRDGVITEGTKCNFFGIFDERLFTHPRTPYILPGITRGVVLDLCAKLGLEVEEFPIFENRLRDADELFIVGTGAEVTPIVKVEGWEVGNGKTGSITQSLQKAFRAMISEMVAEFKGK